MSTSHEGPSTPTAMVTGASRGIGLAVADALAASGFDVIGLARTVRSLAHAHKAVESHGRRFTPLGSRLEDRGEIYGALESLGDTVPDVLVHAAGINRRAPAEVHPDSHWDEVIAVNLTAPFILTREIGRGMLARGSGSVVFIASLLSYQGGVTIPGYAASKGGVAQLTKAFANEWAARGVHVNAVAPGYVQTEMNSALLEDEVRRRQLDDRIPAGRWASPEDIANVVLFLTTPAAGYLHGAVIPVDGGWLGR